ncbi:MAG: serine/threonine-protein kinase, partial [Planctomycetota bacterium]
MIGTTLCHYQVTARLGAGGMGEVYRATDTKLGRDVALKVLPARVAADPDRLTRFRREAKTVALLNHPNIVTIFSVEEDDGTHFLTMELVEGRALDEIIETDCAATRDAFFDLAIPLADAVAAAHARGIVHRDLKPANLMLDAEGRLKVLDFGLAKVAAIAESDAATRSLVTAVGGVVGTAPYMSPEQAKGLTVDERSDVFSLGAVLYELATGRRPFDGDSIPAILYAVVSHEPPPIGPTRPELAGLDRILNACLVKDADARDMTAAQVRDELRALRDGSSSDDNSTLAATDRPVAGPAGTSGAPGTTGGPTAERRSRCPVIAVLPFASVTRNAEMEDFAA